MLKILFAGSPECAAFTLRRLLEKSSPAQSHSPSSENGGAPSYKIEGVLTNPPSAKGRHKELTPTAVGRLAAENNIPVFAPERLDSSFREKIEPLNFDLLVCFAYGHIFGPKFLSLFRLGGVNVHPSLLPKYRGASPVPAAIANRDGETGVSVQTLALKMDEGEILAQEKITLNFTETADSLLEKSADIAAVLLNDFLIKTDSSAVKEIRGAPQQGEPSYTTTIKKEDALIDWNQSAESVDAKIRSLTSAPGAWTRIGSAEGESLKILKAFPLDSERVQEIQKIEETLPGEKKAGTVLAYKKELGIIVKCGKGFLCVTELQRQQKKAMNYKDFMNGARDFPGSVLV